ncbi:MAG: chalcone isomerase family protein [Burkholderiaceae bacterium]
MTVFPHWRRTVHASRALGRVVVRATLGVALLALAAFAFVPLHAQAAVAASAPARGGAVTAAALDPARLPAAATVGGAALRLNGAGVRFVSIYRFYEAGLYLPAQATSADAALAGPGPKRLRIVVLAHGRGGEFAQALVSGLRVRAPAQGARIDALARALSDGGDVRAGDIVDLDELPGTGLVVSRNGRVVATPAAGEGADAFYAALLQGWLGGDAIDARLKAALLGAGPA